MLLVVVGGKSMQAKLMGCLQVHNTLSKKLVVLEGL